MKIWIGLDNGKGTIGIVNQDGEVLDFFITPTIFGQDYTKNKKNVSRIDTPELKKKLELYAPGEDIIVRALVERPMVNSTRFQQSLSSVRMMESMITILETLNIPYQFIDSKEWQKAILPKGTKGSDELKKASKDIGKRLFPNWVIEKHPDMDGLLIAEYGRRNNV